ncbi:intraflagellar transport protein 43 homolog [Anthonomus grandis grandis]|uniref:intraflagellar transport protein 43 homolog n=1 Tax=Anthonomus grandis grandis TaxID=2921223 RepID=UPI0021658C7C|nr:intraflagellar transport protein 43 homolog [Anthonomus grandis grandis]
MNWDEDIDLMPGRKVQPKQGRRSDPNTPGDSNEFFADSNPFDIDNKEDKPLLKPRKTSLWGDEASKTKSSKGTTNIIELERFQLDSKESPRKTDDDDDIPVIPDIDDLQLDDPLNLPDVKPMVSVDKSTYKELDSQLGNVQGDKLNFGNLGNIDLSILTSKLYPEKEVQLKQEVWTMESLFNDLSRGN